MPCGPKNVKENTMGNYHSVSAGSVLICTFACLTNDTVVDL